MRNITFNEIKNNYEFNTYIKGGNSLLGVLGYTEHSVAHSTKVAESAAYILEKLGYSEREIELAKIASYIHDIGNAINRVNHSINGAIMAFTLLTKMEMNPEEIATVIGAIGNHDEETGLPISAVSAALILGDKTDVRRSRVRVADPLKFDIHDRVNYAVEKTSLEVDAEMKTIHFKIQIDTEHCSVLDYLEIFLARMLLCKKAAEYLNTQFKLTINNATLL